MACISLPTAALVGGGLSAAGSVGSALLGSNAAQSAAQAQEQAAQTAANAELQMYGETSAKLQPFTDAGTGAIQTLQGLTGTNAGGNPLTAPLTATFQPTMDQLAKTPGYQFTQQQGLQATQNAAAAQGLGQSGAALKGAANYSTGLASTTYQQQFQNYLSQNQQIYNMISGQASLGENAAAMQGNQGLAAQSQANALTTSGAAAGAAGIVGSANALSGGLSGVTGAASNSLLLGSLGSNGMYGGSNQTLQDIQQDNAQDAND